MITVAKIDFNKVNIGYKFGKISEEPRTAY